ncbi:MAG TPA: DUF2304 family protein [Candidatus Altiarchaeales archaeon]|nr:DUF2304 family protein [Candidatus Altiarchaeales archaeon]
MIIQAFGFLFALFALSRVYFRFREGKMARGMFFVWACVWSAVLAFLAYPSGFESFSKAVGIQRPLDFMFIFGLILVYYLNFRIYIKLEDVRSDMAVLVREFGMERERRK